MKHLLLVLLMLGLAVDGAAQEVGPYLSSQRQPVLISVGVAYQQYEKDALSIEEVSVPLALIVPVGQRFGVSLRASQASATGDNLESVSAVGDVQLGLSYYQRVGEGSIVASLGANLPSGKRELTEDEFLTSVLLSQHFYDFRVPSFGQGFNVTPGLVWAFPAGEGVALGLGVAYQYRGPYQPLDGLPDDYDPGDEIVLTGGLDVRLGRTANLSADVSYALYGADQLGEEEVFDAGDQVTATAQLLNRFGPNELRFVVRFLSAAKSRLPAALGASQEDLRTLPAQVRLLGSYRHRLGERFTLGVLAQARLFGDTDLSQEDLNEPNLGTSTLFDSQTMFDAGLAPEVALSEAVALQARFLYTFGDFTGFEAGGGLTVTL